MELRGIHIPFLYSWTMPSKGTYTGWWWWYGVASCIKNKNHGMVNLSCPYRYKTWFIARESSNKANTNLGYEFWSQLNFFILVMVWMFCLKPRSEFLCSYNHSTGFRSFQPLFVWLIIIIFLYIRLSLEVLLATNITTCKFCERK